VADRARRLLHLAARPRPDDATALAEYAATRDPAAFAVLARRYAPLVLGVCRRILGRRPEAEDACQATFLALVRRAHTVRRPGALPAWLHRVAYRAARRALPKPIEPLSPDTTPTATDDPLAAASWAEVRGLLDRELNQLPDRLRAPLVLCYLDGATRDEAAARLGWSRRTLLRRLERGRTILRDRLARRGLAPVLLGAAALGPGGLRADVSAGLFDGVVRLASGVAPTPAVSALAGSVPSVRLLTTAAAVVFGFALMSVGLPVGGKPPEKPSPAKEVEAATGFPLPPGALRRYGDGTFRHPGGIRTSALSADGKRLATASDRTVLVLDTTTGECLTGFDVGGTTMRPTAEVAFSADGALLAARLGYDAVVVRDVRTGREVYRTGSPEPRRFAFSGLLAFTPDGRHLAVGGDTGTHFLDTRTWARTHSVRPSARLLSPAGPTLVVSDPRDGGLSLVDVAGGPPTELKLRSSPTALTLSPDGRLLAAWNPIGWLEFRTVPDGQTVGPVRRAPDGFTPLRLAFTPDGRTLVAGGATGLVAWSQPGGEVRREIKFPFSGQDRSLRGLHILPDGDTVLACITDGLIRRWSFEDG
jgi:RNA polymerase sigma factor (sigma-70 family)